MKTIFNSWEADIEKCIEKCKNSPFTLKNSDYIVLFHCHNAESHPLEAARYSTPVTYRRTPDRTSSIEHRLYFLRWQAPAHFRNSKTEEKSCSDCAQLAEIQRILLAVSDRMVNCSAFRFQNTVSSTSDSSSLGVWDRGLMTRLVSDRPRSWSWSYTFGLA